MAENITHNSVQFVVAGELAFSEEAAKAALAGEDFQVETGDGLWYFSSDEEGRKYGARNSEGARPIWEATAWSVAEDILSGRLARLCWGWDES